MKRFYSLALFAATLTLTLFSCSQEETQAPMSDLPDGVNRIMFNFGSKGGTTYASKAGEDKVSTLTVYAFNEDGTFSQTLTPKTTGEVNGFYTDIPGLPVGVESKKLSLYFVANTTLTEAQLANETTIQAAVTAATINVADGGFVMTAKQDITLVKEGGLQSISVLVKRAVSRVQMDLPIVAGENQLPVTVTGVKIEGAKASAFLFKEDVHAEGTTPTINYTGSHQTGDTNIPVGYTYPSDGVTVVVSAIIRGDLLEKSVVFNPRKNTNYKITVTGSGKPIDPDEPGLPSLPEIKVDIDEWVDDENFEGDIEFQPQAPKLLVGSVLKINGVDYEVATGNPVIVMPEVPGQAPNAFNIEYQLAKVTTAAVKVVAISGDAACNASANVVTDAATSKYRATVNIKHNLFDKGTRADGWYVMVGEDKVATINFTQALYTAANLEPFTFQEKTFNGLTVMDRNLGAVVGDDEYATDPASFTWEARGYLFSPTVAFGTPGQRVGNAHNHPLAKVIPTQSAQRPIPVYNGGTDQGAGYRKGKDDPCPTGWRIINRSDRNTLFGNATTSDSFTVGLGGAGTNCFAWNADGTQAANKKVVFTRTGAAPSMVLQVTSGTDVMRYPSTGFFSAPGNVNNQATDPDVFFAWAPASGGGLNPVQSGNYIQLSGSGLKVQINNAIGSYSFAVRCVKIQK